MAEKRPRKLSGEKLWNYALKALSTRAHSTGELREKLLLRAEQPQEVEAILRRLKEAGYLNDREFAVSLAEWRLQEDGFGRGRVLRELRARRVAPAVAEQAVRAVYEGVDEEELVQKFLARKYRRVSLAEHFKELKHVAAAYRKLRLAGFSRSAVVRVLSRYHEAAGQLEEAEGVEEAGGEEKGCEWSG